MNCSDSPRFLQPFYLVSCFEMFPHLVRKRQELDAIPVKARWLDRFVWESLHFPDAAISGSAYRGG